MATDLRGKVALVTGANSGIGRALAHHLAAAGVRLALAARSTERLAAVKERLGDADVALLPTDLAQPGEVDAMVDAALARFGRIDMLLANAGLYAPGAVADGDPDYFDQTIAVNLNSVVRATRRVLPGMMQQGSGDILVTSSISGHQALHWEPVYSATKHAIQSFVHGLRIQAAPHGVRVGAIAPGIVLNELWGYTDPAAIAAKVAAHEGLTSDDVAEAAMFMLTRPAHVTIRDLVILPQNQAI
ncbi:SDR family oxidoreductase [Lichenihabitans psoromatis]|uniref:SDR family oxidoreductase n=1 Tax=Lichenihabitans psoromatis TaxID=2528642 RepID=UPI0010368910|nr:SDR family oxidoreductase [Lichenihabitans psoromatis]